MKGLSIKIKTDDINFELDIQELEEKEQDFIREILRMIDRKATTPKEEEKINKLKEDYKTARSGYNALTKNVLGLHKGVDEYIARGIEEQNSSELLEVKFEKCSENTVEVESATCKTEDTNNQNESVLKVPVNSSIRLNHNGEELYQTFYICPSCSNKGKRHLPRQALFITCHNCHNKMRIKNATSKGFPHMDSYGNIFIAGCFERAEDRVQESDSTTTRENNTTI